MSFSAVGGGSSSSSNNHNNTNTHDTANNTNDNNNNNNNNTVIDWDEAMQQCGDDEEFLRELLGDLRSETDTQMAKIEETIRNPTDSPFVQIMRASHVIKGAASNLMCGQLRQTAMNLESAASLAAASAAAAAQAQPHHHHHHDDASSNHNNSSSSMVLQSVQIRYEELKVAVTNYHIYLQSIGV